MTNEIKGYIKMTDVDQENSYYISSKLRTNGGRLVYQFITLKDGTVYELNSDTAATKGILADKCLGSNVPVKEVKLLNQDTITY